MSRKYPYLDIAVSVTEDGRPSTFNLTDGAPTVELPSISRITPHFVSLTEGFMMWNVADRRAYSLFAIDSEMPSAMLTVTLLCQRDVLVSGRHIITLLSSLKNAIMAGEDIDAEKVERLMSTAGFADKPLRSSYDPWGAPTEGGLCCRTYASPGELGNILGFPRQKDYADFRAVIIVPSSVMMAPNSELTQITTPVDKALMVVCPDDVTASAPCVNFSDHLTVTYRCEGFEPVSVMFEVGTTNRYVRINGPALIVNSALHAGIIFRRRVPYSVANPAGMPIDTYTILINDRTANRTSEGFEISNTDFENGRVKITVSSTNFGTFTEMFDTASLPVETPLAIVLEPESKDILIRIDFGEGRVIEEALYIEKNTPEYQQLRAGRFHGFRAHRLMGSKPETYNIDLKHVAAPAVVEATLPFDAPVESVKDEKQAAAPAVATPETPEPAELKPADKMPADIWENSRRTHRAPVFDNVTEDSGVDEASGTKDKRRMIVRAAIGLIAVLAAVFVGMKIYSACSSHGGELTIRDAETANDSIVADDVAPVPGAAALESFTAADNEIESADVDYLNTNKTWRKASLRSEKYKALFEALEKGDVDAFVGNDYFAVEGRSTNSEAQKIVNLMWKAKGSPMEKRHRSIMAEKSDGGAVKLRELYVELSTKMPPESEYNKAVRPSRKVKS